MSRYVVCITGASGTLYGRRLVERLLRRGHEVHLVISNAGVEVMRREEGIVFDSPHDVEPFGVAGDERHALLRHDPQNIAAPVASGSFPVSGVAIVPCSMASVGALASGAGRNLVHRVGDVAMKEGRRLVVAPRETPLSTTHLSNLTTLSRRGVRVVPCMPGFYHGPREVSDLVDFVVDRVAKAMGEDLGLVRPWDPEEEGT